MAEVEAKFGIKKSQFLDLKALKGDASDNIPGVPGIGEKKAENLMRKFKTVANVKAAEMNDLIEAEGISYKDARNIYYYFHDEEGNLK